MKRFFKVFFVLIFLLGNFQNTFAINITKRPKVSVIIPVYKVEPWIKECMNNLINQSLREIQIICVDDGSPDKCGAILDEYAKNDNRILVIHQQNQGVQKARNAGIEKATGEYITFVDSDDYIQLDAYKVAYNSAKKDDVDILEFRKRIFDDGKDNHVIKNNDYSEGKILTKKDYWQTHPGNYVWDKLFKYEIIKKDNIKFTPGIKPADDTCFAYMAVGRAKKIKVIPTKLYNYRIRDGAITKMAWKNHFLNSYAMLKLICDDWRNHGYLKGNEDLILSKLITWSFWYKDICLQHAEEVLNSFGSDIYNSIIVKKCSTDVQNKIKELEYAAISGNNTSIKDGTYTLISALDNSKALDINSSSKENGVNLQLWDKNGTDAQKFEIKYNDGGYYTLKAKCSKKMVDVAKKSTKLGTNIQQWENNNTDAQKWYLIPCENGYYNIISCCNLLALDIAQSQTKNGTKVQCWETNSTKAQKFKFIKVG